MLRTVLACLLAANFAAQPGAQQQPELAIPRLAVTVDGDLAEWPASAPTAELANPAQVVVGKPVWSSAEDLSASLRLACDTNHLYLAGTVTDDQIADGAAAVPIERLDRIEVHFGFPAEGDVGPFRPADHHLSLLPLESLRPWAWVESSRGAGRQAGSSLGGVQVSGRRLAPNRYQFEAAIPFHHFPGLRPGSLVIGCNLVLYDVDAGDAGAVTAMAWSPFDPAEQQGLGRLRMPAPGPLVPVDEDPPLWSGTWVQDLPYLLVPVATLLVLVVLLRGWSRLRAKAPWLRSTLVGTGALLFLLGLWLPSLLVDRRAAAQQEHLQAALATLQSTLGSLEQGTLRSYRGPSRDRALMDLLDGRRIVRQRVTSYRQLAELAPDRFGPGLQWLDDLPVRPYWLPLHLDRAEAFQFEPPLRGSQLHLVLGRSVLPPFHFPIAEPDPLRLQLELDYGTLGKRTKVLDVDEATFSEGGMLGRSSASAGVVTVALDGDLRALTVAALRGVDVRLVGLSLERAEQGKVEPLLLGTPSAGGVLTDLRGPYPIDAGVELAQGATSKVVLPPGIEAPQKLWFFYRASYPGIPTANPGARVAEIVLHFRDGVQKRSILLEHQVSMFYELAVHNTRDDPPEGSPASIALSWNDDSQERHVNLVYPVTDLPSGAELEAIEFRNHANYKMRFRSVVFGNERLAAPQDPPQSPLQREGLERWLPADLLRQIRDGVEVVVYRAGRVSESTLPPTAQRDLPALPRPLPSAGVASTELVTPDGARRAALFAPLSGDGWDGAVLAVTATDPEWVSRRESSHVLGFLLCLGSAPLLLVLLSELLAVAANLRFRLMVVLSVASLVPLGALSLVLVRVLEDGHASDVHDGMRAAVRSAIEQLETQKDRVRSSARQWLRDLAGLTAARTGGVAEAQFEPLVPQVAADLQKLLAGQLPPEWAGGFLRLEWQPSLGAVAADPVVVVAGDARMANVETPARLDPGVFLQWGALMLGVRAEETVRGGTLSLTAGRPIDSALLGALAPGQAVVLTDARGYPLATGGGEGDAATAPLVQSALDPRVMSQRERALQRGVEERGATVERVSTGRGAFVCASEVLRDLQDTPRGLLTVGAPDQRAALELPIGRIPVRPFFALVAGLLVVLAAFLSFVVSGRISRPIERLERGAQALARGLWETRVVVEEGGQIGRLTRTFNQMAADLQGRVMDLQALNRAMRELSQADDAAAMTVLRQFCAGHTPADTVRIVLLEGGRLRIQQGGESVVWSGANHAPWLGRLVGACAALPKGGELVAPWRELAPGCRSLLVLPIVFAERTRGAVLLGFERSEPLPVDLDLLGTVVAQAAIALDRAELHRHAVQDPVTGSLTPDYFRRRLGDEISAAQQRGRAVALLAIELGDGERRPRGLRRFLGALRSALPAHAALCHEGAGRVLAVLPGGEQVDGEAALERAFAAWAELVRQLPENEVEERRPLGVCGGFPTDAPSADLLVDVVRERLAALRTPGAPAMESDESLRRAGVTAVSPSMREVYTTLRRVAPSDLPILLEGETGVGKEVLTNLVHRWSRRAGGPLIKVHCAALSETLLASELFGHEKGAFTGADRRKIGRFEQADGGTLFLDEVGDIPLDVQVKLLRVLQEREVDRVGGTEPVKVDVRVIAATNRDIAAMVAAGRFREDLYYRLQGLVVKVPPLRERRQEIGGLVEHFRREFAAAGQGNALVLLPDALDELARHDWPGNIRELRNTVFRAMVLARGNVVQRRDVQAALGGALPPGVAEQPRGARGADTVPEPLTAAAPPADAKSSRDPVPAGEAEPAGAAKPAAPAREGAVAEQGEPAVVLPSVAPRKPQLPERLRALLQLAVERGMVKTEDHMAAAQVSHRTGLRDLQNLVTLGYLERVGSRRGTFYRPKMASSGESPDRAT